MLIMSFFSHGEATKHQFDRGNRSFSSYWTMFPMSRKIDTVQKYNLASIRTFRETQKLKGFWKAGKLVTDNSYFEAWQKWGADNTQAFLKNNQLDSLCLSTVYDTVYSHFRHAANNTTANNTVEENSDSSVYHYRFSHGKALYVGQDVQRISGKFEYRTLYDSLDREIETQVWLNGKLIESHTTEYAQTKGKLVITKKRDGALASREIELLDPKKKTKTIWKVADGKKLRKGKNILNSDETSKEFIQGEQDRFIATGNWQQDSLVLFGGPEVRRRSVSDDGTITISAHTLPSKYGQWQKSETVFGKDQQVAKEYEYTFEGTPLLRESNEQVGDRFLSKLWGDDGSLEALQTTKYGKNGLPTEQYSLYLPSMQMERLTYVYTYDNK